MDCVPQKGAIKSEPPEPQSVPLLETGPLEVSLGSCRVGRALILSTWCPYKKMATETETPQRVCQVMTEADAGMTRGKPRDPSSSQEGEEDSAASSRGSRPYGHLESGPSACRPMRRSLSSTWASLGQPDSLRFLRQAPPRASHPSRSGSKKRVIL